MTRMEVTARSSLLPCRPGWKVYAQIVGPARGFDYLPAHLRGAHAGRSRCRLVPPDSFTLKSGDQIRITIEPIGKLVNEVA